jgi:hypothetical protein
LRLCQAAGLVKLGHVAVDGTKLRTNASRLEAMSYKHLMQQEPKLAAGVQAGLDRSAAADAGAATRCRTGWPTSSAGSTG